jgi:hydroxymethylbilane synthase
VGQGALAVFAREDDLSTRELLATLDDADSHDEIRAERALLASLEAGCHAPVAGRAVLSGETMRIEAGVFAADGSEVLRDSAAGDRREASAIGRAAAEKLLARGASRLLAAETA